MKTTTFAALASVVFFASSASAQEPNQSPAYYEPSDSFGPGYNAYAWPNGYYSHSSTAGEGYLRGYGEAVRSIGEFRRLSAIAQRHRQEALSRKMDNQVKYAETYFAKRRLNAEYMAEVRGPAPTPEELHAYNATRMPDRLSLSQHSPTNGKLYWPAALESDTFAEARMLASQLFAARANSPFEVGAGNAQEIEQLSKAMHGELKKQITEISPMQYVEAKKFLESMAYEANFPAATVGLAAR